MKVAKIKIYFFTLIWRDSPFSRATIKCDFTVQCPSVHVVNLKQKVAAEFLSSNSFCCRSVKTTRNGLFLRVEYDCFKIFFPTVALPPLLHSGAFDCEYQLQNSQAFWLHFPTLFSQTAVVSDYWSSNYITKYCRWLFVSNVFFQLI